MKIVAIKLPKFLSVFLRIFIRKDRKHT
ncbi:stage V sporulation protein SpoVM [Clostridium yunnanense]